MHSDQEHQELVKLNQELVHTKMIVQRKCNVHEFVQEDIIIQPSKLCESIQILLTLKHINYNWVKNSINS